MVVLQCFIRSGVEGGGGGGDPVAARGLARGQVVDGLAELLQSGLCV